MFTILLTLPQFLKVDISFTIFAISYLLLKYLLIKINKILLVHAMPTSE